MGERYYQHSGRFSVTGLLLALAVGCAGAFILAYAYGSWMHLIPEAHFAAFATIAFGGLVGVGTALGLVWGHVRNKKLALAVSATTTTIALYLSWALWIRFVLRTELHKNISWSGLIAHPRAIWFFMRFINQYGTWALENDTPTKGWALWIVWTLEAALVIGIGIAAAVGLLQQRPYCETCSQWCRNAAHLFLSPVQDPQQLKQQLENKDFTTLEGLGAGVKTADHLSLDLQSCNTCNQFHTLSTRQVWMRRKKFGHPTVSQKTIVRHLIIGPAEAQAIRHMAERNAQRANMVSEKARGAAASQS